MSEIRSSVIAGQWYPGTARELRRTIEGFLARVEPAETPQQVVGLISPHAGYAYSGQTAAYAYNQIRDAHFDVVAVLSPLHRMPLGRFALTSADAYETPLGLVALDKELIDALGREVRVNRAGYDGEHSLEIQLPFLQVVLGDFSLLPVMVGDPSFAAGEELGAALGRVLDGRRALIVASTDLHHIENYREVVRRDKTVVEAIDSFDFSFLGVEVGPKVLYVQYDFISCSGHFFVQPKNPLRQCRRQGAATLTAEKEFLCLSLLVKCYVATTRT